MADSLRISTDAGIVFNPVPLVHESVYSLRDGSKLFALGLNAGITLLVYVSRSVEVGVDYYSRQISVCGYKTAVAYAGVLDLSFVFQSYTNEKVECHVHKISYASAEYLGSLGLWRNGRVVWDGVPVDTTEIQRLYTKCKLLR